MRESQTGGDDTGEMTFHPTDLQAELVELVATIVDKQSGDEQVAALDAEAGSWDETLYASLAEAGVLAALVDGGDDGLGMVGLSLCLIETGARLARIPLAGSVVTSLSLAEAGMDDEVESMAAGTLTAAPALPSRLHSVVRTGDRLQGSVGIVPTGAAASHLLIADDDGRLWFAAKETPGIRTAPTGFAYDNDVAVTIDISIADCRQLDGVDRDGLEGRWRTALSAVAVGACREAVARTAKYTSERVQFGKPLSSKQGVLHRAADAHIDTECMQLTTMNAASLYDAGDSGAARAALEAAWWTATGGSRVVHATQHLHGGMGADLDNHIHRFFVLVREIGIVLGAEDALLEELGGDIVAHAREE